MQIFRITWLMYLQYGASQLDVFVLLNPLIISLFHFPFQSLGQTNNPDHFTWLTKLLN